jgi:hypothetical protein
MAIQETCGSLPAFEGRRTAGSCGADYEIRDWLHRFNSHAIARLVARFPQLEDLLEFLLHRHVGCGFAKISARAINQASSLCSRLKHLHRNGTECNKALCCSYLPH